MRRAASWMVVFGVVVIVAVVASADVMAGQKPEPAASDGWVKLPAPGETMTTAFAVVDNPTMYAIYLVSAAADVAGKVEFRRPGQGGGAEAQPVREVTVPAYEAVSLGPEGVHLLLMDLKRSLKENDKVSLTLTTELGLKLEVSAVVRKE